MDEEFSSQERNEAPTQHKRDKSRRKGQVAFSTDLTNAVLLVCGLSTLKYTAPNIATGMIRLVTDQIRLSSQGELTVPYVTAIFQAAARSSAMICLPLIAIIGFLGIAVSLAQSGILVTTEPLAIDWSKLSPTKGLKRLFSGRAVVRSGMMLMRIALSAFIVYWLTKNRVDEIRFYGQGTLDETLTAGWDLSLAIGIRLGMVYFVLGVADYAYQRFQHERDLRMSKQELREEHKEHEGDSKIKAHIRKMQRESAKAQMLKNVPESTVVIRNPTHFAVALKYDRGSKGAPVVVAKGRDTLARRIIQIAEEHGVAIIERKPLARALYAMVEINQEIPPELYRAIAEILAYVYGFRRSA